jgi:acyl-coenzyme A thioesterase PaaI-like protein
VLTQPSPHPAVRGRERELQTLADEVRRLVALTVTNTATSEETAAVTELLRAAADRLEGHVPDPVPPRYITDMTVHGGLVDRAPFDVIYGPCNPLAVPLDISLEAPGAVGYATFTTPYEGPPECVHGAVIAGTFDMVCSAANHAAGVAGPTAKLTIRYRRPTLLNTETRFEAWVVKSQSRRTVTAGRVLQDGEVTAEAEGLFIVLPRDVVMKLRSRGTPPEVL